MDKWKSNSGVERSELLPSSPEYRFKSFNTTEGLGGAGSLGGGGAKSNNLMCLRICHYNI